MVIKEWATQNDKAGKLQLLTPTHSVMDRLAGYFHWNNKQNLDQAVMIAKKHPIKIKEIELWAKGGGDQAVPICDERMAVQKAREVTAAIAKANNFQFDAFLEKVTFDGNYYQVTRAYDAGLTVPVYKVRITGSGCMVLDVAYENHEG